MFVEMVSILESTFNFIGDFWRRQKHLNDWQVAHTGDDASQYRNHSGTVQYQGTCTSTVEHCIYSIACTIGRYYRYYFT